MRSIHLSLAAALVAAGTLAWAQQAPSTAKPDPAAATSTGTSTSQAEMNRGVPGVNVDTGRNARGAVDVDVDRNTNARNLGTDTRAGGSADMGTQRAPRADRN